MNSAIDGGIAKARMHMISSPSRNTEVEGGIAGLDARSRSAPSTGCRSNSERLMTLRTSAVAVCRSNAS